MREFELKSVVDDVDRRRRAVERGGATLEFEGRLEDRRYDTADRALTRRDEVLRLRTYRDTRGARTTLDWKGPRSVQQGYRVREELNVNAEPVETTAAILDNLGYEIVKAVDRWIAQYTLGAAIIRFERYPRMDDLVEVEGEPHAIERAIDVLGISRDSFNADALTDFVARYERRTGEAAAVCDEELDD
jgi:predicted adenylyl cyclase CyaB